jgi:hypothetical protein
MTNSRRKGARGEHAWAKHMNGRKISRTGHIGPDVHTPPYRAAGLEVWEVKVRDTLPAWLEEWMEQTVRQDADALAFKRNRGDWWVLVPADRLEREWE